MPTFYLRYADRSDESYPVHCDTLDEARNAAVRHLGRYLTTHPDYASSGHWRVNVEDESGALKLHVIVATVDARAESQRATAVRNPHAADDASDLRGGVRPDGA